MRARYAQAGGLAACLGALAAQLGALQGGGRAQDGPGARPAEALAVNVLHVLANSAEYPPFAVDLRRAPQLAAVTGLAGARSAPPAVAAAAAQALRVAGVRGEGAAGSGSA